VFCVVDIAEKEPISVELCIVLIFSYTRGQERNYEGKLVSLMLDFSTSSILLVSCTSVSPSPAYTKNLWCMLERKRKKSLQPIDDVH